MYRRTESAQPRLAREGFIPAIPGKRVNQRHMLIPNTGPIPTTAPENNEIDHIDPGLA